MQVSAMRHCLACTHVSVSYFIRVIDYCSPDDIEGLRVLGQMDKLGHLVLPLVQPLPTHEQVESVSPQAPAIVYPAS